MGIIDESISKYCDMFLKWSNVINIASNKIGRKELEENIDDSLQGVDFIKDEPLVVDIGTGGGLPGIPLAIALPYIKFILVDASRKKCSFLRTVKQELDLTNVTIVNNRLENLPTYPCIVSKAAFSLKNVNMLANHVSFLGSLILWSVPREKIPLREKLAAFSLTLLKEKRYVIAQKERAIFKFGSC